MNPLDTIRDGVRGVMRHVARALNKVTGGRLTPNMVTLIGVLAHLGIAWLIITRHPIWAAGLLIVFGLFDTLDGELARLQNRVSPKGMFFDSATDRLKEILLYVAVIYFLLEGGERDMIIIAAVGALGASLLTSYLNAWGEVSLAGRKSKNHSTNKSFRTGFLSFELRMTLLVIALFTGTLPGMMCVILVLASITVVQRFTYITKQLSDV